MTMVHERLKGITALPLRVRLCPTVHGRSGALDVGDSTKRGYEHNLVLHKTPSQVYLVLEFLGKYPFK